MELELADPQIYNNPELLLQANQRYKEISRQLKTLQEDWDKIALAVEDWEKSW